MKAESTIRREIARLRKMSKDAQLPRSTQHEAYEAYHALRWVIENTSWTPSGLIDSCRPRRMMGDE